MGTEARSEVGKCVCICHVLFFLLAGISYSATQAEIDEAIEKGVAWLAAQQNLPAGDWQDGGSQAGPTGLALVKLQEWA
jgi:hypothetical protein